MSGGWTHDQVAALRKVARWYKFESRHQKIFRLFGPAGTGKTRLAKAIDEEIVNGESQFMAPTAKAAQVLRSKGCLNADTYHALVYNPKERSKARLRDLEALRTKIIADREREISDSARVAFYTRELEKVTRLIEVETKNATRPAFEVNPLAAVREKPLIILDEASMVGTDGGRDLLSFGVPILAIGDPCQLKPIGSEGFFTQQEPDHWLTEIHRQAKDNPIIMLATTVREGGRLKPGRYGESQVISSRELNASMVVSADQLLVGRNKTRRSSNKRIRHLKGIDSLFPVEGDRLICLRNNRDISLWNGAIYKQVDGDAMDGPDSVALNVWDEDLDRKITCAAHLGTFLGQEVPWYEKKDYEEFDYGYALTVHKSQGSQWDNVTLFDEWFQRETRKQWVYTGITRAAEKLTVVQFEE